MNSPVPQAPGQEMLDRLCYLVGPARGGTSIVHASFDVHPRALVLPALSHFADVTWPARRAVGDRAFQALFNSPRYYHRAEVLAQLPQADADALRRHLAATMKRGSFREVYQLYPLMLALSPGNGKDVRQLLVWHDKTNNWRNVALVARNMPLARFVFLARDPRDSVLSIARRAARKEGRSADGALSPGDVVEAALYWRTMMGRGLRFLRRYPGRAIFIRFEDFVRAPARTLNEVFAFTSGETLEEGVIRSSLSGLEGGASNAPDETYTGISTAPVERWKRELGEAERQLVVQATAPVAAELGYDVGVPPRRLLAVLRSIRGNARRARAAARRAAAAWPW